MSTPPPVVVQKKRGLGCCGCGCLILALLALLFFALIGGMAYLGHGKLNQLLTTAPEEVPSFNGGPDVAQAAQKKCADFLQAVHQHQAASLELSADELNTLIEQNPGYTDSGSHIFVTMTDDRAEIEASIPLSAFKWGVLEDRFLNGDAAFSLNFNADTRQLNLILHAFRMGRLSGSENLLSGFQGTFSQSINQQIRANPEGKEILDNAKLIEVRDGKLEIETQ